MEVMSNAFEGRLIGCQDLPSKAAIFGRSEGMKGLWQVVERVASASVPILILGERGAGKEVLARFIHACSPGPAAPFLKVSPHAADSYVIGGLTLRVEPEGADGKNSCVGGGDSVRRMCTLFVEEVAEVTPADQLELLQLIQGFKSLISSGGTDIPVILRAIATSTHELEREVAGGKFREDLFSFLSVITLRLPPLRERKEDIPQLANHFWRIYSQQFGCQPDPPSPRLIEHLQQHDWPGNIRELENAMKRYVVLGAEGIASMGEDASGQEVVSLRPAVSRSLSLKDLTREAAHALERKIILRTLQETQWNRRRTARALNISYRALLYKIKEGGLLSQQSKATVGSPRGHAQKSSHEVV